MSIFRSAAEMTNDEFRHHSLSWLQRQIGFDGVVWGAGVQEANGQIGIREHYLEGRPPTWIDEYSAIAAIDPMSREFVRAPNRLQMCSIPHRYRERHLQPARDYLERHYIRQVLLLGMNLAPGQQLNWIVFYREDPHRPFDSQRGNAFSSAVQAVLFAQQLRRAAQTCLRHQEGDPLAPVMAPHETGMTPRQQQVLDGLLQGWPNKLISRRLGISENTLKKHVAAVFHVLGVHTRAEAIIAARQLGLHQ